MWKSMPKKEKYHIINDDLIYFSNGKYYFYDETWAYSHGPFDSKMKAEEELVKYVEWLERKLL